MILAIVMNVRRSFLHNKFVTHFQNAPHENNCQREYVTV